MKHTFIIEYRTEFGQHLCLNIGGQAIAMHTGDGVMWEVTLDNIESPATYHYSVVRGLNVEREEWHKIPHRITSSERRRDWWIDDPAYGHSALRVAGTLVPVFSLRSEKSFGVGDFGDLQLMVDWAAQTRQRVLQILPVNDTTQSHTWRDSYPYSAVSVYALHPMYVCLHALPALRDKKLAAEMERLRVELNALPEVDYERVNTAKVEYLRALFTQGGRRTLQSKDYKAFYAENEFWLVPYARFCQQRDSSDTVDFYNYTQYILARQLEAAHEHARRVGVLLKGDIPIGVNRHGCDVLMDPDLFDMDGQAGAPPDDFAADGQNWGFPTYRWDRMVQDGCSWWVRRLQHMSHYFDAYRIDHVLGFFRIWRIPMGHSSGLEGRFVPAMGLNDLHGLPEALFIKDEEGLFHPRIGARREAAYGSLSDYDRWRFDCLYDDYFYRRHNQFWYDEAMRKLPCLVNATDMIVCAEDLGMVPDCVPWALGSLHILSMEVMSMPKALGRRFGNPRENPYLSVCTLSTHDMPTLRQWWDEDWERAQDFFTNQLHREGPAPHPLPAPLARDIIAEQLASPSMLCIQSLQDWMATDEQLRHPNAQCERINIPANPNHYWRWRMHITIEQLMGCKGFCQKISDLIGSLR